MATAVRLSNQRAARLRAQFDELAETFTAGADPVDFVHRYQDADDQEVAALFASALAFGRVASFTPVLDRIFDLSDQVGGPAAWVDRCTHTADPGLDPVFYRWVRGDDLARFAATIGRFRARHGSVRAWLDKKVHPQQPELVQLLGLLIDEFRELSAPEPDETFATLSRGYKHLLPHPSSGSACKRWCMLARWMSRTDSPDVGLWPIQPESLIIPLDTHIHRIARMVGLTRRNDGSWRTATEVTANLRRIDPDDPVRFDFVLAHLGIDGRCKGRRIAAICSECSLAPVCNTGRSG